MITAFSRGSKGTSYSFRRNSSLSRGEKGIERTRAEERERAEAVGPVGVCGLREFMKRSDTMFSATRRNAHVREGRQTRAPTTSDILRTKTRP